MLRAISQILTTQVIASDSELILWFILGHQTWLLCPRTRERRNAMWLSPTFLLHVFGSHLLFLYCLCLWLVGLSVNVCLFVYLFVWQPLSESLSGSQFLCLLRSLSLSLSLPLQHLCVFTGDPGSKGWWRNVLYERDNSQKRFGSLVYDHPLTCTLHGPWNASPHN